MARTANDNRYYDRGSKENWSFNWHHGFDWNISVKGFKKLSKYHNLKIEIQKN